MKLFSSPRRRLSGGDSLRTQKDDRVIDEPNFVGSFSYGDYVYFWYREKASDALDNNRETQIYSRVGRVCANDPGGPSPAQDRWSSFLKLRLNCSVPGDGDISPFYFNEIQSISDPIPYGGNSVDALVYAIFQTSRSLPMSAVCAFRMSQIDSTQRSPTSLWTPSQKFYSNPSERPGQCGPDASNRLSDMAPISKNPLMYETVSTIGNSPLLVEGPNRADLTAIAVTADALSIRRQKHNAIFLIDLSQNGTAVLVETIKVFPLLTPIIGIRLLPNTSNNNIPSLIVSSLSQVANIPLQHCSLAENCGRCVALRDPNVLLGVSEQCPGFTSILGNAESGAAYVIDEDVLGGGGLQNLSPLNNRLNDPLSDDSDAAHIAEPTQRGIDLAGLYSTGSLSVLVLLVLVATLFGFVIGWRIAKWRTLSEFTRNNPASSGASTSSNSSDYADGTDGSARARLARQDSTEQKMMMLAGNNVYSVGPRSCVCNGGDTV
uniref:Sema domain-containing protein n=1 Tax=Meloidogyne javanica TaxID=6303 RepID=A0A915NAP0_MELJA